MQQSAATPRRPSRFPLWRCVAVVLTFANSAWLLKPAIAAEPDSPTFSQVDREYWLWQPVTRPPVPGSADMHPIDAFLMTPDAREAQREADRRTLIRRATFDLHGLSPTPQ